MGSGTLIVIGGLAYLWFSGRQKVKAAAQEVIAQPSKIKEIAEAAPQIVELVVQEIAETKPEAVQAVIEELAEVAPALAVAPKEAAAYPEEVTAPYQAVPYITRVLFDRLPEMGHHVWWKFYNISGSRPEFLPRRILKPFTSYPIGVSFNHLGGPETLYTISLDGQSLDVVAAEGYWVWGTAVQRVMGRELMLNTGGPGSYTADVKLQRYGAVTDYVRIFYDVE